MAETLGIASLNLLLDKTRSGYPQDHNQYVEPQYERIDSLSKTLGSLPISLDVVMLQEAHITRDHNNGERLMENLGIDKGFWVQHNELSRKAEYLGVIGHAVESVEAFDVGDNRKALLTVVGGIAMVGIHNRCGINNVYIRTQQIKKVLDRISEFEKAIILGDSNEHPWRESRKLMTDSGFTSVYKMKKSSAVLPATFPTKHYRTVTLNPTRAKLARRGVSIDVIELRGFDDSEVVNADVRIPEKSDHKALFAKLAPAKH